MKIKSEDVNNILDAINDLIEIKVMIRRSVPTYNLDESSTIQFLKLLKHLHRNLHPIFSSYLNSKRIIFAQQSNKNLKEMILDLLGSGNIALLSANSSKKKLKNLGIDPRQVIVSGGPFFFEDYELINQNLQEKAINNIKKKCDRILTEIKSINWSKKDLIFFYEKANNTDKIIFNKLDKISELIGKNVKSIEINSWKDLDF